MKTKKVVLSLLGIVGCIICVSADTLQPQRQGASDQNETDAVQALCGGYGYGIDGSCLQEPGAMAGAYVYAGTGLPYDAPGETVSVPDSLQVIFVNHIGRHGARYLSSDKFSRKVEKAISKDDELTEVGLRVHRLCVIVDSLSAGHWGALDELGCREQSGIGERFAERYSGLLANNDSIIGFSSYIPRCVMSMDEMTHGVVWENRDLELSLGSGKRYTPLVRAFDIDSAFKEYQDSPAWHNAYNEFRNKTCPTEVALRLSERGSRFLERMCWELIVRGVQNAGGPLEAALADTLACDWPPEWELEAGMSKDKAMEVAEALYRIVGGSQSLFVTTNVPDNTYTGWLNYFTEQEYARLWECSNLKHYLEWTTTCYGDEPARMAEALLREMLATMDAAAAPDYNGPAAIVRFGHAETLMPLYALMHLPGCYYVTDDLGTVSAHWQDFDVVPMAANLQMVLTRSKTTGKEYLLMYRNECPVGAPELWSNAKERFAGYLPSSE
ncbi:MAG: hypothetical protein NC217_01290 [Muribaculaceae bacterium]|nr:hypothetical protein [Muribaculaceae bacterium]